MYTYRVSQEGRRCIMAATILAVQNTEYLVSPGLDPKMLQNDTAAKPRHAIRPIDTILPLTVPPRVTTYEALYEKRRVPDPLLFLIPDNYILVLPKVKGEPLHRRWADASAQRKEFVYQQGSTAIHVL
ncbi:hypothetical protein N7519_002891 [Penicillium mononematosum]|uniref:uncharacterized protein n=1 Tax=Penicillium mononematosum TaxID=268346 RepID=UPI002547407F|nr:uncharacterized protein N7519_002891 [Penicillium mononematosum]KAJ6187983.1 hypothetical protein N7519_002891 [Penicillium mononematosum]